VQLDATSTIAVIGEQARTPIVVGGGSGAVGTRLVVSPLESIAARVRATAGASVIFSDGSNLTNASATAAGADRVLVFVGTSSREGADRADLRLGAQDDLISAVAEAAGNKTAVVIATPGAVLTDWRDGVGAILTAFMPGQQYGDAIASLLFGDESPRGKLPLTFPANENDVGFTPQQWPGTHSYNNGTSLNTTCTGWHDTGHCTALYSERLEVGYRYYAAHAVKPAFAFGHGLSYATFDYSALQISGRTVSCRITNSGAVQATEVAQLYLRFPDVAGEPPLQLKAFETLSLPAGSSASVRFDLTDRSFSIWDVSKHAWTVVAGTYTVLVGSSSVDIRLTASLSVGPE
jgi:beta-glucosidase